jgi:TDG/mug DNA glycosylase family protein
LEQSPSYEAKREAAKPARLATQNAKKPRAPEVAARSPNEPWVELLKPALDVVFLGFNPSLPAWRTGHYYANPGNRFYALLFASGLTPRLFSPHEDRLLLAQGIGAADLVLEPSARADELPASRFVDAAPGLVARLSRVAPRAVCCNGVGVYRAIFRENPPALGLVPGKEIAGAVVFVSPSTSGLANGFSRQRSAVFQQLADWLRAHPRV